MMIVHSITAHFWERLLLFCVIMFFFIRISVLMRPYFTIKPRIVV